MQLPTLGTVVPLLLDAAIRGAVILGVAALLALLLRRRSAATRHAIWTIALVAQLALPILGATLPAWRVAVRGVPGWLLPRSGDDAAPMAEGMPTLAAELRALDARRDRIGQAVGESAAPLGVEAGRAAPGAAGGPPQRHDASARDAARHRNAASVIDRTPSATSTAPARPPVLVLLWLAGCVAILVRFGIGTLVVSRLAQTAPRVQDGSWLALAQRIAERLGIRRPLTLLRGDRLGVPVTWGVVYPVVLLPEEADDWSEERRTYVLVHEMAHVKRLDALTQLVAQLATALFWFDPLVWYAARRMRAEREHACDDYVLRYGTTPSTYASDLLEMVRALGSPSYRGAQPAFAALAMARRSEFEGRMLSILDPHLDRHPLRRRGTLALAALSLALVLPLAAFTPTAPAHTPARVETAGTPVAEPAMGATTAAPAAAAPAPVVSFYSQQSSERVPAGSPAPAQTRRGDLPEESMCRVSRDGSVRSVNSYVEDAPGWEETRIVLATRARCVRAGIRGPITVADDEREVTVAARGELHLADRAAQGELRELIVRADASGRQTRIHRVNGVERPLAEARPWLDEVIPYLLRESGIEATARVARLRRHGGTDAVLAEIAQLTSDGVRRRYFEALLATPRLSAADAERALRLASATITSDGDLRAVLTAATKRDGGQGTRFDAETVGEATRHITSDGDLRAVLHKFVTQGDRSFKLMALREARRISSDGDLSGLLMAAVPYVLSGDDAVYQREFFKTAEGITSDGDLANVLLAATAYARPNNDITDGVIATSTRITADGDRANVLVRLAQRRVLGTRALRRKFLESAKGITSDGDYRRVIEALQ